jgi:nicotinate dehydrogenase subunit A
MTRFTVNGRPAEVTADPDTPLLDVLRNDLALLGSRFGCGLGQCGACLVQVNGQAVSSCDTPLWSVAGKSVVTVEGLADGDTPHPVQRALLDEQAAQCGFCVSGIVVRAATLLESNPHPDEESVAAALDGNLCRCGAHRRIIRAIVKANR